VSLHSLLLLLLLPVLLAVTLVTCPVRVSNPGNLELRDITIEGHASTVVSACAMTFLGPAVSYDCTVTK
jgi:hypothetical protein